MASSKSLAVAGSMVKIRIARRSFRLATSVWKFNLASLDLATSTWLKDLPTEKSLPTKSKIWRWTFHGTNKQLRNLIIRKDTTIKHQPDIRKKTKKQQSNLMVRKDNKHRQSTHPDDLISPKSHQSSFLDNFIHFIQFLFWEVHIMISQLIG